MNYFKEFPIFDYNFNRTSEYIPIVNIHRLAKVVPGYLDQIIEYSFYRIPDGERPDITAQRLYDNPDYYWTFFIINDFLSDGLSSWPMSAKQLAKYLVATFPGQTLITKPVVTGEGISMVYDNNINADAPNDSRTFTVGEQIEIYNGASLVGTCKLHRMSMDVNQLVVIGDTVQMGNKIIGTESGKEVIIYKTYDTKEAPFYYYDQDQDTPETCNEFFGDVSDPNRLIDTMKYVSNRQYAVTTNDTRSNIRIISPKYIDDFVDTYMTLINTGG